MNNLHVEEEALTFKNNIIRLKSADLQHKWSINIIKSAGNKAEFINTGSWMTPETEDKTTEVKVAKYDI